MPRPDIRHNSRRTDRVTPPVWPVRSLPRRSRSNSRPRTSRPLSTERNSWTSVFLPEPDIRDIYSTVYRPFSVALRKSCRILCIRTRTLAFVHYLLCCISAALLLHLSYVSYSTDKNNNLRYPEQFFSLSNSQNNSLTTFCQHIAAIGSSKKNPDRNTDRCLLVVERVFWYTGCVT